MHERVSGDIWVGLCRDALPVDDAQQWATLPSCGAVVTFAGTVRDHAPGRDGVTALEYEAYDEHVEPRLRLIADEVRTRWPDTQRVALLHRVGRLELTEVSVVVVVSAPHRAEAFEAARYAIDSLKASVPIWKKEIWAGGEDWATGSTDIRDEVAP